MGRVTWSRRLRVGLCVCCAVLGLAAVAAVAGTGAIRVRAHAGVTAPRPLVSGHIASSARVAPLPTSGCVALIGIRCYSPAQFERAYNLAGLHASGITGAGQTIAIVDAFGSPTIVNDHMPSTRPSASRMPTASRSTRRS